MDCYDDHNDRLKDELFSILKIQHNPVCIVLLNCTKKLIIHQFSSSKISILFVPQVRVIVAFSKLKTSYCRPVGSCREGLEMEERIRSEGTWPEWPGYWACAVQSWSSVTLQSWCCFIQLQSCITATQSTSTCCWSAHDDGDQAENGIWPEHCQTWPQWQTTAGTRHWQAWQGFGCKAISPSRYYTGHTLILL